MSTRPRLADDNAEAARSLGLINARLQLWMPCAITWWCKTRFKGREPGIEQGPRPAVGETPPAAPGTTRQGQQNQPFCTTPSTPQPPQPWPLTHSLPPLYTVKVCP